MLNFMIISSAAVMHLTEGMEVYSWKLERISFYLAWSLKSLLIASDWATEQLKLATCYIINEAQSLVTNIIHTDTDFNNYM